MSGRTTVLVDASKGESVTVHSGLRWMHRKLKNQWRVETHTGEITEDALAEARIFVIPGPRNKFTQSELDAIRSHIAQGGSVLVMLGEGGEMASDTNINFLLEEYGVMINSDTVVRTVFYRYYHPKEALVSNGVLNRALATAAGRHGAPVILDDDDENNAQALHFVYPFGSTLLVNRLAIPVLSTGSVCFPLNRPVAAFHHNRDSDGKLAVIGSVHAFADNYIDKEDNGRIFDVFIQFLSESFRLNPVDAEDPDITEAHAIPDHIQMSQQIKVCLQEGEGELPGRDLAKLFDASLYSLDLSMLPACLRAFRELSVPHDPLTLIAPQFETPLPPLAPAVFPPAFRALGPPALELFDLDEVFSSESVRLAQVANKCGEDDLEYLVRESADILGVSAKLPADQRDALHLLEYIFAQVAEFKKLNQETGLETTNQAEPIFNPEEDFIDDDDFDI